MNIFARFHRNKVHPIDEISHPNHKQLCMCKQCKKYRKKEMKVSCGFLMPMVAIIGFISALT